MWIVGIARLERLQRRDRLRVTPRLPFGTGAFYLDRGCSGQQDARAVVGAARARIVAAIGQHIGVPEMSQPIVGGDRQSALERGFCGLALIMPPILDEAAGTVCGGEFGVERQCTIDRFLRVAIGLAFGRLAIFTNDQPCLGQPGMGRREAGFAIDDAAIKQDRLAQRYSSALRPEVARGGIVGGNGGIYGQRRACRDAVADRRCGTGLTD